MNEPLLSGDPDESVLGIIAIPELHLLIGNAILLLYGNIYIKSNYLLKLRLISYEFVSHWDQLWNREVNE